MLYSNSPRNHLTGKVDIRQAAFTHHESILGSSFLAHLILGNVVTWGG